MKEVIVVVDSRCDAPKNIFVFSKADVFVAEKKYIDLIIENNVEIEDEDHRSALLDDGICETADGYVAIWHDVL